MRLLLNWVLSALAVWIVAQVVPGVYVNGAMAVPMPIGEIKPGIKKPQLTQRTQRIAQRTRRHWCG